MIKGLKFVALAVFTLTFLSACQVTGKATDVVPGVDVEYNDTGSSSTNEGSGKDNNAAWNNGEHCPPGQEKKGKCNNDD